MNFLRRMMMGRYGGDPLNNALLLLCLLLIALRWATGWAVMGWLAVALLFLCYFRMYSRNINARYKENQRFMGFWNPIRQRLRDASARFADRKTHRYYKCPQCGKRLRVPRGRGKINITCPQCRTQFIRKS